MRLYVAGPMTGYPEFNYPAFREAERELREAGYDTLNPVDSERYNTTGRTQTWDWYMRHALRMVLDADGIALLPGWEKSRGATLERHVGQSLGLECLPVGMWLVRRVDIWGEP